jgi:hypothetical protein
VAKLYAKLLSETGFLTKGDVIFKVPADFLGLNAGDTAAKTKAIMESSKGNVLVIDEAYGLTGDGNINKAAVDTIVAYSPTQAGSDMSIILCGYKGEINELLDKMNPGLKRRFPESCTIEFDSFDEEELSAIFAQKAKSKGLSYPIAVRLRAAEWLTRESKLSSFGNGGAVENLIEKMSSFAESRVRALRDSPNDNPVPQKNTSTYQIYLDMRNERVLSLADFKSATHRDRIDDGMDLLPEIVAEVDRMQAAIDHARYLGRPTPDISHMLFLGPAGNLSLVATAVRSIPYIFTSTLFNIGVGKTTAARKMAFLLYDKGLLPTDKCVTVVADSLVAGYIGQTAEKVRNIMKEALGGCLFIDEAHRLNPGNTGAGEFKREVIGVFLDIMTSVEWKNKILIVFAGYEGDGSDITSFRLSQP